MVQHEHLAQPVIQGVSSIWGRIRRSLPVLLLPPAVFLLAAGVTRQLTRTRDGLAYGDWQRRYQAAVRTGMAGDRDRALRELRAAAQVAPADAEAHTQMAVAFETLGQRRLAIDHLLRATELRPQAELAPASYLAVVSQYCEAGLFDRAGRVLRERVLPRWPNEPEGHFYDGVIFLHGTKGQEGLESALASLDRCLRLAPKHIDARYQRGICLARLGRPAEAERLFRSLLPERPVHPGLTYALADALRQQGRRAEAEKMLARFKEIEAKQRRAGILRERMATGRATPDELMELAGLRLEFGEPEPAVDALRAFLRKAPADPRGHRLAAEALRRLGRTEEGAAERKLAAALEERQASR